MTEILPFPEAIEFETPPIIAGGVSNLIYEIRKKMMGDEKYSEEVGKDFGLTGEEINLKK